jgi:hypothetical protein
MRMSTHEFIPFPPSLLESAESTFNLNSMCATPDGADNNHLILGRQSVRQSESCMGKREGKHSELRGGAPAELDRKAQSFARGGRRGKEKEENRS